MPTKKKPAAFVPAVFNLLGHVSEQKQTALADAFARAADPWHDERQAHRLALDAAHGQVMKAGRKKGGINSGATRRDEAAHHTEELRRLVEITERNHSGWLAGAIAKDVRRQYRASHAAAIAQKTPDDNEVRRLDRMARLSITAMKARIRRAKKISVT